MARSQRTIVEVRCDRCTRVEERDSSDDRGNDASFSAAMDLGKGVVPFTVRFEDLCGPCYRTVKNHLEQIGKKLEGTSPDRVAKSTEVPVLEAEVHVVVEPVARDTKAQKTKEPSFLPAPEARSK